MDSRLEGICVYCCPTKELSCFAESKYDIQPEYLIRRASMELSVTVGDQVVSNEIGFWELY